MGDRVASLCADRAAPRRGVSHRVLAALLIIVSAAPAFAGRPGVVDDADRVRLRGNVHPLARPEFDAGATPADLPMPRMILALQIDPEKQGTLEQLLSAQQDPESPQYHRWLTPAEFGAQ